MSETDDLRARAAQAKRLSASLCDVADSSLLLSLATTYENEAAAAEAVADQGLDEV